MEFGKKILCLLAIFCILGSCIAAVSAEDINRYDGGYAGSQYYANEGGYAGSQYNISEEGGYAGINYYENEGGWAGSQYNATLENMNANATAHSNVTPAHAANATHNVTNTTAAQTKLPSTGNPLLILMGGVALLGAAAALRRKN